MNNDDKLLTMKEVGKMLGLGRDRTYELFRQKDFPCVKFNKTAVIYESDLHSYLKSHRGKIVYL